MAAGIFLWKGTGVGAEEVKGADVYGGPTPCWAAEIMRLNHPTSFFFFFLICILFYSHLFLIPTAFVPRISALPLELERPLSGHFLNVDS